MLTVAGIACYNCSSEENKTAVSLRAPSYGLRLQKMALWISPNNAMVLFCLVQWRCSGGAELPHWKLLGTCREPVSFGGNIQRYSLTSSGGILYGIVLPIREGSQLLHGL